MGANDPQSLSKLMLCPRSSYWNISQNSVIVQKLERKGGRFPLTVPRDFLAIVALLLVPLSIIVVSVCCMHAYDDCSNDDATHPFFFWMRSKRKRIPSEVI